MKKLVTLCLSLLLLMPVCASASDVDLASMSFDELVALKEGILEEIVSRPEFKEVTVPTGVYIVGEDIPVGAYTVTLKSNGFGEVEINDSYKSSYMLTSSSSQIGKLDLKKDDVVKITGTIISQKYAGLDF